MEAGKGQEEQNPTRTRVIPYNSSRSCFTARAGLILLGMLLGLHHGQSFPNPSQTFPRWMELLDLVAL